MQTRLFLPFFLILLSTSSPLLFSQTGSENRLAVEAGDEFEYEGVTTQRMSSIEDDAKFAPKTEQTGAFEILRVDSIDGKNIYWTIEVLVKKSSSDFVLPITTQMMTDLDGRPQQGDVDLLEDDLFSITISDPSKELQSKGPGWSLTSDVASMEVGEEWVVENIDTMKMGGKVGIDMWMEVDYKLIYTFAGIVDTLGGTMVRVDWRSERSKLKMNLEISVEEPQTILMSGEGSMRGVTYYLSSDRMMYAEQTETDMTMTVETNGVSQKLQAIRQDEKLRQE